MAAAFTPGPWKVSRGPRTGQLCVVTADPRGAWICGQLHNQPAQMAGEEAQANATLIAAAPLMHAALVEARAIIAHASDGCEDLLAQIDAALDAAPVQ